LKYPLFLIKEITGKSYPQWENFVNKVSELRKRWFLLGDERYVSLLDLLKESVEIVNTLIKDVDVFLIENKIIDLPSSEGFFIEKEHVNLYLDVSSSGDGQSDNWSLTCGLYLRLGCPNSILPPNYLIQRRYLEEAIQGKNSTGIINQDYLASLSNRYHLFAEEIAFLNKNKVPFKSLLKYDYLTTKPKIYLSYLNIRHKMLSYKLNKFMSKRSKS
jgi:hypothetical protein